MFQLTWSVDQSKPSERDSRKGAVTIGGRVGCDRQARSIAREPVAELPIEVVTLLFVGCRYPLTRQQSELLIYKLSGMASGAFSKEIDYLGVGKQWLPDASRLADALYLALHDSIAVSIELDQARAFALYQVLRVTYAGQPPNALTCLYESLKKRYH